MSPDVMHRINNSEIGQNLRQSRSFMRTACGVYHGIIAFGCIEYRFLEGEQRLSLGACDGYIFRQAKIDPNQKFVPSYSRCAWTRCSKGLERDASLKARAPKTTLVLHSRDTFVSNPLFVGRCLRTAEKTLRFMHTVMNLE